MTTRILRKLIIMVAVLLPAALTQAAEPEIMSIHLIDRYLNDGQRNVFSRHDYTVRQILEDMLGILNQTDLEAIIGRFEGDPAVMPRFFSGDTAQLKSDLEYLLNVFPQTGGVFSNPLSVGEKSFVDDVGNYFTTDEPERFTPLPSSNTYVLNFYAGKDTAATSAFGILENVEIVTRDNRYRIFAREEPVPASVADVSALNLAGALILSLMVAALGWRLIRA